ncbi:M48 family metallopeptidase [Aquipseudomonas ullengensis]|uniref:M48 family metallopeptidase n=1 Tax=Aquipseudomonas ullengensis TaxID=2759166 RepID=A0A7W4QBJ9_9GAMM|nr:M48 family metallopeptidase [Pseudomonas ullengensis]MBB2496769.1 M48 family metallopeptidase [Pseudomonas ullengensis]
MNFFEQQDRAQRNTGRLVLLLALAVASLITITCVALIVVLNYSGVVHTLVDPRYTQGRLVLYVALAVVGVVILGGLFKSAQLSRGGKVVAERLGGRLINLDAQGLEERRLLNVVEEMAIASGTPVPPVYLLDDLSINAFAAGLTPQDAVIGIARGAIATLSRDELQGVIAHEFSHIFNGDMRLNIRLVSVLHGILLLGLIGEVLLRNSGSGRSSSRSSRDGGSVSVTILIGLVLLVVGYAGTFFGGLIKAAVSRQREFLADASAVQFTRNPDSIAGALKKIGGHSLGSQLQASHAAEFSHLYFGPGVSRAVAGMMATHPPLEERIRRIEPGWDGLYPQVSVAALFDSQEPSGRSTPEAGAAAHFALGDAEQAIAAVGDPQMAHLRQARDTLRSLPAALKSAAHTSIGAQALVYGLLLGHDAELQARQLGLLRPELDPALLGVITGLRAELLSLDPGQRLPLLELALPALKQLGKAEFASMKGLLIRLIKADNRVELLEWTLLRIVERHVEGPRLPGGKQHLLELADEAAVLLSALAHAGHVESQQAAEAFAAATAELPFDQLTLRSPAQADLKTLSAALDRLNQLQPLQKPRLLKAMARCITHDGSIHPAEAELLRAVAETLDCPMPPLLANSPD